MHIEDFHLMAHGQRLAATRVRRDTHDPVHVMTLHGLGERANRHTARYLLDELAMNGHGSICFEFSGNGDSTGILAESTLRRRHDEAKSVAQILDADLAPVLIGTSMGAHLASWITPALRPAGLVLFCPAAYPANVEHRRFGEQFVRPGRHNDSPAYAGLSEFEGDLLVIGARNDQVVPPPTIEGYLEAAVKARRREVIWLDGCDHFIHRWLPNQDSSKNEVFAAILRIVSAATRFQ